jgi:hypothetical protein
LVSFFNYEFKTFLFLDLLVMFNHC